MFEGIEFQSITFGYDQDTPVLQGIEFSIEKGSFVGIFGPNGAGKSTLLKIAAGLLSPTQGKVIISGRSMHELPRIRAAKIAAYVPPVLTTPFPYTVFEFAGLAHIAQPGWAALDKSTKDQINNALRMVDMQDMAERSVTSLSSGEQKLTLLARAIVQGPDTLLLDEPLANLDMSHSIHVMQTLTDLQKKHGLTVVCVSHEVNIPMQFVEQVMLLNRRVIAFGPPDSVMLYPLLKKTFHTELYIGRNEINNKLFIVPM